MFTYNTKGTCSRQIIFDVDGENKIHNVKFIGGLQRQPARHFQTRGRKEYRRGRNFSPRH